jgi:hypothetical protein
MALQEDGQILLNNHATLFEQIKSLPLTRPIYYREDLEEGHCIGKPRFHHRKLQWSPEILTTLHNHLQNLWNFFSQYSYWFDSLTKELLEWDSRSLSKKSVKFLLERDVWETAEVYGAYLIEENKDETVISYYRFQSRVKSYKFPLMSKKEREEWIISDAISQIQTQLAYLWNHLQTEIEVCLEEQHHKFPPITIQSRNLMDQLEMVQEIMSQSQEASLLLLGRLSEIWLLQALHLTEAGNHYLIAEARHKHLLRKEDARFFSQLRKHYNNLKHSQIYNVNNCPLNRFIQQFHYFLDQG